MVNLWFAFGSVAILRARMTVNVHYQNEQLALEVGPDDTVSNLLQQLEDATNQQFVGQSTVSFGGTEHPKSALLSDVGITAESVVYVLQTLKLRFKSYHFQRVSDMYSFQADSDRKAVDVQVSVGDDITSLIQQTHAFQIEELGADPYQWELNDAGTNECGNLEAFWGNTLHGLQKAEIGLVPMAADCDPLRGSENPFFDGGQGCY